MSGLEDKTLACAEANVVSPLLHQVSTSFDDVFQEHLDDDVNNLFSLIFISFGVG